MKFSALLVHRLKWLNLPGAVLLALLQRTPAVRVVATAEQLVAASPLGDVLRSAVAVAASLGAIHSMAGATTLSTNSRPSPLSATVGTAVTTVVYSVLGTQGPPLSWTIGGSIPPGVSFSGLTAPGVVNIASNSFLTLAGTPTTAGSYSVTLKAWENSNGKGNASPTYTYVITVGAGTTSTSAPTFSTHPTSQTVTAGASVSFTAAASGSPTPTYQWNFNGGAISGATSASYTISSVQSGNAGNYSVTASNSAGNAASNTATLTVNAATSAPTMTTNPTSQTVTAGSSATFTAAASGSPTPTYQWNFNGGAISGATSASYTISSAQSGNAGNYTVTATNSIGSATSNVATLAVTPAGSLPVVNTQPVSQSMALGSTVVFSVDATNATSFQWKLNGISLPGKTNAVLVIPNLAATNAGNYTCVVFNGSTSVTTTAATLTAGNFSAADTGHLVNVSVLSMAGPGSKVLTVGAVIGPAGFTSSLPLVVRAVGPTLGLPAAQGGFDVPGVLADPVLTVFSAGNPTPIATNNNWGGGSNMMAAFSAVGAFALPAKSLDSAFVAVSSGGLAPGGYTVQVTDNGGATGTVLAEVYDAGDAGRTATTPRLINLSTLASIDAGSSLTAGFVLRGSTSRTLLIRGIGPTLGLPTAQGGFEVGNTMGDPKLELFNDASVKIAENDNWGGDSQLITAMASVGAFGIPSATSKDAVLLITLTPGSYSARVSDTTGAAGTAIVEIYEVP